MLELTAEHFFDRQRRPTLRRLVHDYPLAVHGLGLSLGTPGPLDRGTYAAFAEVARVSEALWVSDHLAFTCAGSIDLGHLNPIPLTTESLKTISTHVEEVQARTGKQLLLENITTHLQLPGDYSEPAFLNAVRAVTGCGFLLDVTNLFINGRNHGFDPVDWLGELDLTGVRQMHVVGYAESSCGYEDLHADAIQHDLFTLIDSVLARTAPELVLLERDQNLHDVAGIAQELRRLEARHAVPV